MSLDTWINEYYPMSAVMCSAKDAIAHSLRKWEGLRPGVLAEHSLYVRHYAIIESDGTDSGRGFGINSMTCALCHQYYDKHKPGYNDLDEGSKAEHTCSKCPLAVARGGVPCDSELPGERHSPYEMLFFNKDPEPMIRWLKEAK